MVPDTILFDLDGTLIDSVPDIAEAVAELMRSEGLAAFAEAEVREMVGHGVAMLVERAFARHGIALDTAAKQQKLEKMMVIYPRHLVDRSRLMPGTLETLSALAARHCRLAVVTNKPQQAADTVLDHFDIARFFDSVVGDRPLAADRLAPKPAPDLLLHALRRMDRDAASAVMVGDSSADILSAAAAGIRSVGLRNGYSHEPIDSFHPTLVLDSMAELPGSLDRLA